MNMFQTRKLHPKIASSLGALLFSMVFASSANAVQVGTTHEGIPFASGGIGESERIALQEMQGNYNLRLLTAAIRTGQYLADVNIRITSVDGKRVYLEHRMDGPWLMVRLPQGQFAVFATFQRDESNGGQQLKRVFTIPPGKQQRQLALYFEFTD